MIIKLESSKGQKIKKNVHPENSEETKRFRLWGHISSHFLQRMSYGVCQPFLEKGMGDIWRPS